MIRCVPSQSALFFRRLALLAVCVPVCLPRTPVLCFPTLGLCFATQSAKNLNRATDITKTTKARCVAWRSVAMAHRANSPRIIPVPGSAARRYIGPHRIRSITAGFQCDALGPCDGAARRGVARRGSLHLSSRRALHRHEESRAAGRGDVGCPMSPGDWIETWCYGSRPSEAEGRHQTVMADAAGCDHPVNRRAVTPYREPIDLFSEATTFAHRQGPWLGPAHCGRLGVEKDTREVVNRSVSHTHEPTSGVILPLRGSRISQSCRSVSLAAGGRALLSSLLSFRTVFN